jgi:hypothetical protein
MAGTGSLAPGSGTAGQVGGALAQRAERQAALLRCHGRVTESLPKPEGRPLNGGEWQQ